MQVIKDYRDNKELRNSFNKLAEKVFGLNFENWYRNGFWKENYNPHSIIEDGKIVANISVNRCPVNCDGRIFDLIQLGTVMTDPEYRGRGYSRKLMEEILKEYDGKADGIYLYANNSVLEFYPKFGFTERQEYRYFRNIDSTATSTVDKISMETPADLAKMTEIMKTKPQAGNMTMTGNEGLFMFYLSQFMKDTVYYIANLDTYAVAETEDGTLMLHAVWGSADPDAVIDAFGGGFKRAVLLFTPVNISGYESEPVKEEDTTFFVKGRAFDDLKGRKFMFQAISHA